MKNFTVPLLLIAFSGFILGQTSTPKATTIAKTESMRGVVVEEVARNSAAEKAGLREGDVLLAWHRGDATGNIESPFDIPWLEIEGSPLGSISLVGVRETERRAWVLGSGAWGVHVRPSFSGSLLVVYNEAQQMARDGKAEESAERWKTMSREVKPASARVWLLLRAAEAHIRAEQLEKADGECQEAFKEASTTVVQVGLLRSCAAAFQKVYERDKTPAYYQKALEVGSKSGADGLIAAASLQDLAQFAFWFDEFTKTEDYARKALAIQQRLVPDSLPVASSLTELALAAWKREDFVTAEQYHQQALSIRKKLSPDSLDVAESFNGLGIVARDSGNLKKAEEYHLQALAIREKLAPGSLEMAKSLSNLGVVNRTRGDLVTAENYFRQTLAIREKLSPGSLELAGILSNLAVVIHERGDLVRAEEYGRRALVIREKLIPGSMAVADSLNNIGLLLRERDDLDGAEDYFQRALAIAERRSPGSAYVGRVLENIGALALLGEDLAKAEMYCQRALVIHEKVDPGSLQNAVDLDCLGGVALKQKNLNLSRQRYLDALAMREKVSPASVEIGSILLSLADVAYQMGDLDKAEGYARRGATMLEQLAPGTKDHAAALASLALIRRSKQQPEEAAKLFDQAINSIEQQAAHLGGGGEIGAEFRAKEMNYYREYLDLLVQTGKTDLAFQVLERSRSRSLLAMLGESRADIRKGITRDMVEKELSLQEQLTLKSNRRNQVLNDSHEAAQADGLDKEIQEIIRQYQELEEQIRQTSPGYAALTQPPRVNVKEVQEWILDSDTLLLEYALGKERSHVFLLTRESIAVFPLAKQEEIDAVAREVYRLLSQRMGRDFNSRQKYTKAITRLSQMVLGAVTGLLNKRRVLVVSDGALQYIPFAVLVTGGDAPAPLVVQHEVVNLPSASVLAVLRRQLSGRKIAPKAVAILADPVFDVHDDRLRLANKNGRPDPPNTIEVSWQSGLDRSAREVGIARGGMFPRLPFSRREAEAIYSTAQRGTATLALDFEASKATAMLPQLRDYRIVHFATHGLLDNEHPELSGLVFSLVDQQGKTQDGFLRLIDIYNLDLSADLVVLSACQTALGKQIAEEGLVGLTRGFMYAGAPRVVASLWKVDDEATAELMKKFYEGMLKNGQTPAQALRAAQIWMSQQKRWRLPYYWAGFILQGEWN